MITLRRTVDMVPGGPRTIFPLNQYDEDFILEIPLLARDGVFTVEEGTTVEVQGTKPDGNGYSADATLDARNPVVTVQGDVQMTAAAGRAVMELVLKKDGKVLHSANFELDVARTALDKDTIASDSKLKQFADVYDDHVDEIITAGQQYAAYKEEMDELEAAATAAAQSTAVDKAAVTAARLSFDAASRQATTDLNTAANAAISQINDKAEAVAAIVVASDTLSRQALNSAGNAENDVAELGTAVAVIQNSIRVLTNASAAHLAGLMVMNGALYGVNEDGDIIAGPIEGISGSGGGGGGGSAATSQITLNNTSGFNAKAVAATESCVLSISWSSVADEMPTGDGTLTIMVNGVTKSVQNIHQGEVSVDVTDFLIAGSNTVRLTVKDNQDNARFTTFNITKVDLSISSTFDSSTPFTGAFSFPFTPVGVVQKNIVVLVDGSVVDTIVTSVSGRQMSATIPAQSHGAHTIECYFTAEVNGQTVSSNRLYFEVMCLETLNTAPIITSSFTADSISQYAMVLIPWRVYVPNAATGDVSLYLNGALVSEQTVDRTEQTYSFRANTAGTNTFRIVCGTAQKTITVSVVESEVDVEAVTEALALHLIAQGRSNNEATRNVWESGNISAVLSGFNWRQDGWLTDADGVDVLRLEGDARVTIPYKIFEQDFKGTGKTIEIEFATRQVSDYTATILSCFADNIGLQITPQNVVFRGAQNEISTLYKDNEHVRLSITVDKQTENRLILIYINGVMSRAVQYASGERFSQLSPVGISIGSSDCGIDIYGIRVYDNNLSREEILDNWIADCPDGAEMLARFSHNNVYDEYGKITPANLPSDLPYFILEATELPQYKGDKKTITGSYVDPVYTGKSFTFEGCQINVQGTSSAPYYRKNYDMQFKGGFITNAGTVENYALSANSIPFNRFVLKAALASPESANNTRLVEFYNDTCPFKIPEMRTDPRVRWGIEGYPIVVFWYNPDTQETQFMGKYNFNLPKRAPGPYGYSGNDESWEVERNNSANVKFQDDDLATLAWDELEQEWYPAWYDDFEARFPSDEWRDTGKLQEFLSWVKSTDRSQATGDALPYPVTYILASSITVDSYSSDNTFTVTDETENGVATGNKIMTFTADTPAYRLTKFRAECQDRVEMESAYFYYLFTELFLMIDSRAKNMFFGFHGGPVTLSGSALDRKVVFEPYDMDTAIGTNNSGVLMFGPALEDTDTVSAVISGSGGGSNAPVFNGQDSVFWMNLRDSFRSELTTMYRQLRSDRVWSYAAVEALYENHQSKWPEAIFNEDAWTKYIVPLVDPVTVDASTGQLIRTDRYLTMLQGSKEEQRKWWLWNRFRYMDSKFVTGDASSNIISLRVFNSGRLTLKSAIDMYVAVSFGGGTTVSLQRTTANTGVNFDYETQSGVTEMETWIYSADLITDVGDLSVFYPNELDFSKATRLKRLKIGSAVSGYSNANLRTLDVRNSELLEHIDCRNCPNLNITVNLEGSPRLKEAYFDGTSITGVDLVDGGALETLHLPATITTLTLLNLSKLTDLTVASYANVSRLMLANMDDSVVDIISILQAIRANSQVYIEGLYLEAANAQEIEDFLDLLDTMSGVTREKNANGEWLYHDYETAQVSGTIHTSALTGAQVASYNARYPYITVTADHVTSYLTYKNYDGSQTIKTVTCLDGVPQESAPSVPSRSSTAQYDYTAVGWNTTADAQVAEAGCTSNVIADRTVYAAYSRTVRTYTVTWKNSDGTVLETDNNVPYGTTPTYNGSTPQNPTSGGGAFQGWSPAVSAVTGNVIYTASYIVTYTVYFYNGSTLLQTVTGVTSGGSATYTGTTPTKTGVEDPENYQFSGWSPSNTNIQANTSCYAQYNFIGIEETITDSWAEIFANISNGTYATKYSIGDTKKLDLGTEGMVAMKIVAFDADDLASGNGKAPITWISEQLLATSHRMNPSRAGESGNYTEGTGAIGGWDKSEMRTYLRETVKPLIPSAVRSAIVEVTKTQPSYTTAGSSTTQTTTDDVWIPSYTEMFSSSGLYHTAFPDNASRVKKKAGAGSASWWWLRSASNFNSFNTVYSDGSYGPNYANYSGGISLGFCT